jgi:hypothetical protein
MYTTNRKHTQQTGAHTTLPLSQPQQHQEYQELTKTPGALLADNFSEQATWEPINLLLKH